MLPRQRDGKVEPEAVDVHLGDPVAKRIHHQAQADGAVGVQGVAGTGRVEVVARVVGDQAVVPRVVETPEGERWAEMTALGRVVEDDVEDHLEPGRVKRLDHRLELGHLATGSPGSSRGRVSGVRGEAAEGVVAPVVVEPLSSKQGVVEVVVNRQQFHGRDAQCPKMVDGGGRGEPGIGPAQLHRDVGVALREPLDMDLIYDRVGVGDLRRAVVAPVECVAQDNPARHERCRIQVAVTVRRTARIAQDFIAPGDVAVYRPGVGIEQKLVGVAAESPCRLERSDDPVSVALPRRHSRDETVPDPAVFLLKLELLLLTLLVEQAQQHALGDLRGNGEVRARFRRGRAQRKGTTRPQLHLDGNPRQAFHE